MRAAKWLAGIVAGLALLLAAGVILVTVVVDPNRFKGRIERMVSEASGQPFKIAGDLDIAWYPWLALRMGEARLGETPLVAWRSAGVGARLIPLLQGRLVVSRVRVEGLRVHLVRASDGQGNWEALTGARASSKADRPWPEIAGIEIRDGMLEYRDAKGGSRLAMRDWRLDLGAWKPGEPVSLSTTFTLQPTAPSGKAFPVSMTIPRLDLTMQPLYASIPGFTLAVANASIEGKATLARLQPLRAQGALSLETDSLRRLMDHLAIVVPRPRDARTLAALDLKADWAIADGALKVKPIALQLDDTAFSGELTRPAGAQAILRFELRGDRIALDRYVQIESVSTEPFELPVAQLKALRVAGVLSFAEAQLASATIKNARIRLETPDGRLEPASETPGAVGTAAGERLAP